MGPSQFAAIVPGPRFRPSQAGLVPWMCDPLAFLLEAGHYGGVVNFRLGTESVYLISEPEAVRRVLSGDQSALVKGPSFQKAREMFLGDGLLTSDGGLHDRQRRLLQPVFHRHQVARYADTVGELAEARQSTWHHGEHLDLHEEMKMLMITSIMRTLFSRHIADQEAQTISGLVTDALDAMSTLAIPGFGVLRHLPLPATRRLRRANQQLGSMVDELLSRQCPAPDGSGDLVTALLDAPLPEGPDGLRLARDEVITMLLAGHETTSNTLAFAWYLLASHPSAGTRLREELDSVVGDRRAGADDIARLSYTRAVLSETLRLYPPLWSFSRLTVSDYELEGQAIPIGSVLMISPWLTHRSVEVFTEPHRFSPERWLDQVARPRYAFYPFGGGRRRCIGEGLAQAAGTVVLANVARHWSMRLVGPPVQAQALLTLRPRGGVPVTMQRRGQENGLA